MQQMNLSARARHRIFKLARTTAELAGEGEVQVMTSPKSCTIGHWNSLWQIARCMQEKPGGLALYLPFPLQTILSIAVALGIGEFAYPKCNCQNDKQVSTKNISPVNNKRRNYAATY